MALSFDNRHWDGRVFTKRTCRVGVALPILGANMDFGPALSEETGLSRAGREFSVLP
ncbi:hypothetical protein [Planktomarina temperata]|uniref:hypothetical protein n=1 Tax=Planktomarina temperata TaxID=1284658 RepID=UPI00146ACBF4